MPSQKSALLRTVQLADRLDAHIRTLNLSPGDSFLSTAEASKFLGVAGETANRALRLLEKRGVIIRRQRLGSIVSKPKTENRSNLDFAVIYFLFPKPYLQTDGFDYEEVLLGLQEEHPNTSIEHFFLDEGLEERLTSQIIDKSLKSGSPTGIVLVRAPFGVQQLIEKSGLPAVLYGTKPEGIETLSSMDRDHPEAIRLVHHYLQTKKCQHAALLMRNFVLAGDVKAINYFYRISDIQTSLLFVPPYEKAVESTVRKLLSEKQPPDALICHTKQFTLKALEIVHSEGWNVQVVYLGAMDRKDFNVVKDADAVILTDWEQIQIGHRIGHSLNNQFHEKKQYDEIIPVRLIVRR
ncbi:MAG: GntR family transcriptional regulator [Planctomycetaceae bacterium]|jgi:DNA-binding LacI/PurR family transcriptional regulator|nr:GntR family transcriptional regulator [Planctomycetaceae bacterium]